MKLTDEQRAVLDGSKGETLAKVMESLVRYGEISLLPSGSRLWGLYMN